MTFLEIVVFLAILLIMLVGLAGVILPVLPGIPLIAGAALLYGIITGFEKITPGIILIFAGFTGLGLVIDYITNYFSVRKMGGGRAGAKRSISRDSIFTYRIAAFCQIFSGPSRIACYDRICVRDLDNQDCHVFCGPRFSSGLFLNGVLSFACGSPCYSTYQRIDEYKYPDLFSVMIQ